MEPEPEDSVERLLAGRELVSNKPHFAPEKYRGVWSADGSTAPQYPGLCCWASAHPPCSDPGRSLPGIAAPVQELRILPGPGAFDCCGTFPCSATCRGRSSDLLLFHLLCFPLAFAWPLHLLPLCKGPAGCPGSVRPGGQCCPSDELAMQGWQCPRVTVLPSPALLSHHSPT